jgi:hypothetical protein
MTTGDGCLGYDASGDCEEAGSVCCSDGGSSFQCQDGVCELPRLHAGVSRRRTIGRMFFIGLR